jgi:hypothetical protein
MPFQHRINIRPLILAILITDEPEERIELTARATLLADHYPVTFALGTPGSDDTLLPPCACLPPHAETPVT